MKSASEPLALDARGVTKSFDGNVVLDDLCLTVAPGSVHALLGHNGSGKSTFIKVLAGYYAPDASSNEAFVGGTPIDYGNPESVRRAGASFVHQTLGLIPTLTVLENLRLGKPYRTNSWGSIRWREERDAAREELEGFGLHIDPSTPLNQLTSVERTSVAIVRALGEDPGNNRLLVLDEPTSALDQAEVRRLFETIRNVQRRGVGVLYVSHRLEEVEMIADDVTVLRDGVAVGEGKVSDFSMSRLVALISGDASHPRASGGTPLRPQTGGQALQGTPRLVVRALAAGGLRDLDLEARGGEVLGIVGLVGSGLDRILPALTASCPVRSGDVTVDGRAVDLKSIASVFDAGVSVVSANRNHRVLQDMSIRENLSLPVLARFWRRGYLRRRAEDRHAARMIDEFGIRPRRLEPAMRTLSGGNQQKVAVARAIQTSPAVFVLEEPTQGVDASGRKDIYGMLRACAADGTAVIVIDSDLDEVVELCSRVVVLRHGQVVAELAGSDLEKFAILRACYGSQLADTFAGQE